jgi:hypothetical protein
MTQTEALRLALEALEAHADIGIKSDKAITAIKAALEAKDELVQWKMGASGIGGTGVIVQPQRTWVGLTDDEIEMIVENRRAAHWEFVRQVEAKLKEKNHG